ncbi:hypothetical protein DPMN_012578 [Dreissena polymorpha]|uniref:Uncharacterized protein n=1 Tax=Dreissena polymorpha TaxID=45954 RepID=A0A9D4S3H7_DREPO|nr:hypothetical protein DPMN_012578 [Dreissena polymorpha]
MKKQSAFLEQIRNMYNVLKEMGNPFQEESKDLSLNTKVIAAAGAIEQLSKHLPNGMERFKTFMTELETFDTNSFYAPIKKTKLNFVQQKIQPASQNVNQRG